MDSKDTSCSDGNLLSGMAGTNLPLSDETILAHLPTVRIGNRIIVLKEIDSTNLYLLGASGDELPDGTVVVTEYQQHGRGRHGRRWLSSPSRNLLFSFLLRSSRSPDGLATLTTALSLVEVLRSLALPVEIKWPNDIVHRDQTIPVDQGNLRKLAGILCESRRESGGLYRLVMGVGLNVNVTSNDFFEQGINTATSLAVLSGMQIDRNHLLAILLAQIDRNWKIYESTDNGVLVTRARSLCGTLGHFIRLKMGHQFLEGQAIDLDEFGRLVIRLESGINRVVGMGEIEETRSVG